MADTTLKIEFGGDDPRRSDTQDSSQKNPAGATPVQSATDVIGEVFQYEATGLAGNAASAATATFDGAAAGAAGLAEGVATAGAAAAGGLEGTLGGAAAGAVGGPPGMLIGAVVGAGMALGGMADGIDLVIAGFAALYDSVMAVDDTMRSIVEDIRAFSMPVAQAQAMYEINEMLAMINRANVLGPDTANYLSARSEINVALADINTTLASFLVPLATEGAEDLAAIIGLISDGIKWAADAFTAVGGSGTLSSALGTIAPAWAYIHAYLQNLERTRNKGAALAIAADLDDLFTGKSGFGPGLGPAALDLRTRVRQLGGPGGASKRAF